MAYNFVQTVFMLNMASNGVSDFWGTQEELTGWLNVYLNGGTDPNGQPFQGFFPFTQSLLIGGDWSVKWGPVALIPSATDQSASPLQAACNAMFVAYSPSQSAYVVAIAATNPTSVYDWTVEDGDVDPQYAAAWPVSLPFQRTYHLMPYIETPAITAATAQGISLLNGMQDPTTGQTLQQFLTATANTADTLYFTGHSLAGALAPTLAFYLYPDPSAGGSSGWAQVLTMPTAGATPGNAVFINGKSKVEKSFQGFTQAYAATATGSSDSTLYPQWNCDVPNANDVVPHAWNMLGQVLSPVPNTTPPQYNTLWGIAEGEFGTDLATAVTSAITLSAAGDYTNIPHFPAEGFTPEWGYYAWQPLLGGGFEFPPVWTPVTPYTAANPMTTAAQLGQMIMASHIAAYYQYFGVAPVPKLPAVSTLQPNPSMAYRNLLQAAAKVSV